MERVPGLLADAVLLLAVAGSATVGALSGFVWQAAVTGGMALGAGTGLLGAWWCGAAVGRALRLASPGGEILVFFFFFAVVGTGARIAAEMLKERIRRLRLKRFDQVWGGLLGALKGILGAMAVVTLLSVSPGFRGIMERGFFTRNLVSVGRLFFPGRGRAAPPAGEKERKRPSNGGQGSSYKTAR